MSSSSSFMKCSCSAFSASFLSSSSSSSLKRKFRNRHSPLFAFKTTNSNNGKVVWFRDHALRVSDNQALTSAVRDSGNTPHVIVPIYLWASQGRQEDPPAPATATSMKHVSTPLDKTKGGTAKDVFVLNALDNLNATLYGNLSLGIVNHSPEDIAKELIQICHVVHAKEVYYLKSHNEKEESIVEAMLQDNGIAPRSFGGSFSLINYSNHRVPWKDIIMEHPWRSPLIPFVDYVKKILDESPKEVLDVPKDLQNCIMALGNESIVSNPCLMSDLKNVVGTSSGGTNWGESISRSWPASEEEASKALSSFLRSLGEKGENIKHTHLASRLSPYLARGLISPGQVYNGIKSVGEESDIDSFVRRICWRDYTYAAIQLHPRVIDGKAIREGYEDMENGIPMDETERCRRLQSWKRGQTGFPLIDAGMRQLMVEGWMPQKVRLACSTFLVEGLGLSWKDGMQHFAEFLVDYDEAINSNMWQNAGCVGLDPYYVGMNYKRRMYWDLDGDYVRRWCPELRNLPDSVEVDVGKTSKVVDCLYEPWSSPSSILETAGVILGKTYPKKVCNDRETRAVFFDNVRRLRLNWPSIKIDDRKRDFVNIGSGEKLGLFTPRAVQIRESVHVH